MDRRSSVLALGVFCLGLMFLVAGCSTPGSPGASPARPSLVPSAADCSGLAAKIADFKNARITKSEMVADDARYPAYCLVQGKVDERTGVDGKVYAIGFEMRLPKAWNGRFLYQANGGNDGIVVAAEGDPNDLNAVGNVTALSRGFAVLSTNAGHDAADPANASTGLLAGNLFGLDPKARSDYGYASVAAMMPVARALIAGYYGKGPSYSYMFGCSNGGRHGMVAASRYGDYFDGILAGDPGFDLPRAAVQHGWDVQSFETANPDIRKSFSREDMKLVAAKVVEKCDALDGVKDGIVADVRGCGNLFSLSELQCKGEKNDACLSADQVKALQRSMGGPKDSSGARLYSDWPYDGGMGGQNWRFWKLESGVPPWDGYPLIAVMGAGSLECIFSTPPAKTAGDPASLVGFLTHYDFDKDAPKIYARDGIFKESAMEFMTPPDMQNPKLAGFRARGGKMIIYQGQSDPVFSANAITGWYEKLTSNYGGDAGSFVRLFLIPGMNHCSGGPATDEFDALTALMSWVEAGRPPDRLTASVDPANSELPADWSKTRTRPLCVWPKIAKYVGGDKEKAASFTCELP